MKKLIYVFGILAVILLMNFGLSDFFSSMTKVDYVEGSKTLKFTTKMNTENIAEALKINPNSAGFEAEVKGYVNKNFDVYVDGQPKVLTFTGSQVNGESVWVYFETGSVSDIKTLKIKNSLLLASFPKQINMVTIAYKGAQKVLNFQRGKEEGEVSF